MTPGAGPLVPISHQSPDFLEVEVGPFRITRAGFDARGRIEPHYHDRPNFGVMLEGSFDLTFGRHRFDCTPGTLFLEPAGETHCNCMGCKGALVLAIQPDPDRLGRAFNEPTTTRHPRVRQFGLRIAREIDERDEFAALMVQGLAYELIALAGRALRRKTSGEPSWLPRIVALLRSSRPARVTLHQLAREADVHPAHLARVFRAHFGCSLGRFLLEERLDWAAQELAASDRPISQVALQAGFADQSHFTRRFRAWTGLTPRNFRTSSRA